EMIRHHACHTPEQGLRSSTISRQEVSTPRLTEPTLADRGRGRLRIERRARDEREKETRVDRAPQLDGDAAGSNRRQHPKASSRMKIRRGPRGPHRRVADIGFEPGCCPFCQALGQSGFRRQWRGKGKLFATDGRHWLRALGLLDFVVEVRQALSYHERR